MDVLRSIRMEMGLDVVPVDAVELEERDTKELTGMVSVNKYKREQIELTFLEFSIQITQW